MFCGSFGYVPKILLAYTSETGSLQPWQKIQATWAQLPVMWCHGAAETTGGVMASRNRCSRPHHDCSFFGSAAVDCFNTTAAAAIVTNRRWICGWLVASSSMSDSEYTSKSRSEQTRCGVHCSTTNEFPLNAENENCEKHCTIGKQMTCTSKWISK